MKVQTFKQELYNALLLLHIAEEENKRLTQANAEIISHLPC